MPATLVGAQQVLGLEKRIRTNDSEPRRTNCSYPLRYGQECELKHRSGSG